MEKVTILVCTYYYEDFNEGGKKLYWQELPYLDSLEKKKEQEEKFFRTHKYLGEHLSFIEAIKIDGKIFADIYGVLGNATKKIGIKLPK